MLSTHSRDNQGALDGVTIFRFAHIWRHPNSGGVEAYLDSLNQHLLDRSKIRILQMFLAPIEKAQEIEVISKGRGELVWIPATINMRKNSSTFYGAKIRSKLLRIVRPQRDICHRYLISTLENYRIDLAIFHWISDDSPVVLDYVRKRHIPVAFVNHFQNSRLTLKRIRSQVFPADAIAGISNVDIPKFIANRYTNLSDAVDTDYFCINRVDIQETVADGNDAIVLLPARIAQGKGHIDAIAAIEMIKGMGIKVKLVFAGNINNHDYMARLTRSIVKKGLQQNIFYAGRLDRDELRKLYAKSSIVILPSHEEGLGKVLLEAQAMGKPVIAYNVGGVPEALRDGQTGFLVEKGDSSALAKKMMLLLNDHHLRKQMGNTGRQFMISEFSLNALAVRHEQFYLDCCKR